MTGGLSTEQLRQQCIQMTLDYQRRLKESEWKKRMFALACAAFYEVWPRTSSNNTVEDALDFFRKRLSTFWHGMSGIDEATGQHGVLAAETALRSAFDEANVRMIQGFVGAPENRAVLALAEQNLKFMSVMEGFASQVVGMREEINTVFRDAGILDEAHIWAVQTDSDQLRRAGTEYSAVVARIQTLSKDNFFTQEWNWRNGNGEIYRTEFRSVQILNDLSQGQFHGNQTFTTTWTMDVL